MARKKRTRQHVIADLSVNHIERYALRCGFSAERVQHDYGIDLVLFTYSGDGEIEPGQVYVQLKATDNLNVLQDRQTIAFPVKRSDLELWLREPMPYILVIYDAQADIAYWVYVQAYFEQMTDFSLERAGDIVIVHLHRARVVDEDAVRRFARYKNSILQQLDGTGVVHRDE